MWDLVEENLAPHRKPWGITDTSLPEEKGKKDEKGNLARIFFCVTSTMSCALPISSSAILVFPSALFAAASTRLAYASTACYRFLGKDDLHHLGTSMYLGKQEAGTGEDDWVASVSLPPLTVI